MKRYFFNLSDGTRERDDTGQPFVDDMAAQREAIRFAGEILKHEPDRLEHGCLKVDVNDEAGAVLFVVDVQLREGVAAG